MKRQEVRVRYSFRGSNIIMVMMVVLRWFPNYIVQDMSLEKVNLVLKVKSTELSFTCSFDIFMLRWVKIIYSFVFLETVNIII